MVKPHVSWPGFLTLVPIGAQLWWGHVWKFMSTTIDFKTEIFLTTLVRYFSVTTMSAIFISKQNDCRECLFHLNAHYKNWAYQVLTNLMLPWSVISYCPLSCPMVVALVVANHKLVTTMGDHDCDMLLIGFLSQTIFEVSFRALHTCLGHTHKNMVRQILWQFNQYHVSFICM